MRLSEVEAGHEASDAKLLHYFEQIDLSVELLDAILEDPFVLLELAALLRAAALTPTCAEEPVQTVPALPPTVPMVRIAEYSPILDRFLQLVLLVDFIASEARHLGLSSTFLVLLPHREHFLDQ